MDAAGPTADPAAQLPDGLQVAEALKLYSSFYRAPADWRALMDTLGLAGQSTTRFGRLSGGQKQRLSIALALVGSPQVTVLDELTTGLDPQARRDTWDLIEDVRSRGVTIVLVTHVMEEAERLCDRVALIDAGCVVAVDTPAALAGRVQAEQRIGFRPSVPLDDALLTGLPEVTSVTRRGEVVMVTGNDNALNAVTSVLARHQIVARQLRVEQASLEDAFLALTGLPTVRTGTRSRRGHVRHDRAACYRPGFRPGTAYHHRAEADRSRGGQVLRPPGGPADPAGHLRHHPVLHAAACLPGRLHASSACQPSARREAPMSEFSGLENEAESLAKDHPQEADKAMDEAAQFADRETGNKFDSQIQSGEGAVENKFGIQDQDQGQQN